MLVPLLLALDLVVASHNLRVARRRAVAAALATVVAVRGRAGSSRRRSWRSNRAGWRSSRRRGRAVVHVVLDLGGSRLHAAVAAADCASRRDVVAVVVVGGAIGPAAAVAVVAVHDDVGDAAAVLGVLVEDLVVVVGFGELGDDVPGVDQAGDLRGRSVGGET